MKQSNPLAGLIILCLFAIALGVAVTGIYWVITHYAGRGLLILFLVLALGAVFWSWRTR